MKSYKLIVYAPLSNADKVRQALGDAGAGTLGNYTHYSFSSKGQGRFLPINGANPTIGKVGEFETVEEERIEVTCDESTVRQVIKAMQSAHIYEEIAYDLYERIEL